MKLNYYTLAILFLLIIPVGKTSASNKWKRPISNTVFKLSNSSSGIYEQKIVVISNRHFEPDGNSIAMRGVHHKRELFYFVVTQSADTACIIPYPDLESAMEVFREENEFLLFVNGHGKTFEQVVERGFSVGARYNTNMIMFDWPTDYYAIRKSISNARKVTNNFVQVSSELEGILSKKTPDYMASVVFHSMGNRILHKAVQRGLLADLPENMFDNLILNAAAVKQKNHASWVSQLNIQRQVYIVSNEGDLPLKGVKMMRFAKQLGSGYKSPLAENATYINFSEIATKEHNTFLGLTPVEKEHPNIFEFYNLVFNNRKIDVTNKNDFAEGVVPGLFFIM